MTPFLIIERRHCDKESIHKTGFEGAIPSKHHHRFENAINSAKGFTEYTEKHGYHFTEELAEHASKMMKNANGQTHTWTAAQVKKALESLGYMPSSKDATLGDIAYAANMLYADFYPEVIKDEASCLKGANALASDPDGYEGMIFTRWASDVMAKAVSIDWEKFV